MAVVEAKEAYRERYGRRNQLGICRFEGSADVCRRDRSVDDTLSDVVLPDTGPATHERRARLGVGAAAHLPEL